jgi:hypothetical protein
MHWRGHASAFAADEQRILAPEDEVQIGQGSLRAEQHEPGGPRPAHLLKGGKTLVPNDLNVG